MSIGNKSPELKAERGYTDPKSFVRPDGTEVLKGKDWAKRKQELWERAQGHCEFVIYVPMLDRPGCRCPIDSGDPCHDPIPRHPKRIDNLSNLKFYCRFHHGLTEPQRARRTRFGEGRGAGKET